MSHATHLHLDCYAGISGDMLLGALVDLGAPLGEISAKLAGLPIGPFVLRAEPVMRGGIRATRVHVEVEEEGHVHRHLGDVYAIIDAAGLPSRALDRARRAYRLLAEAEARVHGTTVEKIHFHEVGAKDAILDIAASALALELLGIETVSTGHVTTGFGMVKCAHGMMPVPAPATAELLLGLTTRAGTIEAEMVTPTGAALLRALISEGLGEADAPDAHHGHEEHAHAHEHEEHAHTHDHEHGHAHSHDDEHGHAHEHPHAHAHTHEHEHGHTHTHAHGHAHGHAHDHAHDHPHDHPHAHTHAVVFTEMPAPMALDALTPLRIGYGAGGRDFPGHANCLRALLCPPPSASAAQPSKSAAALPVERHTVLLLETEIDDMAPELAGHVLERLLAAGAYDVQLQPVQMKKNRPGLRLRALAEPALEATLAELIFRETSTFGVRRQLIERWCLVRRIEQVKTPFGPVPVKIGMWDDELLKASPEYEACRAMAAQTHLPLHEVYDLVRRCAADQLRRP